jgi:hypothetical protein
MGLREDLQKRIDRKLQELAEKEAAFRIEHASTLAYIQALQDTQKSLPRETPEAAAQALRPGSAMAQAHAALKRAGRPLHISELLVAMGRENTKELRSVVGGSLANYVRRGEIFIRTAPNTFGLVGMTSPAMAEPPAGFGTLRPADLVSAASDDEDETEVDQPDGEVEGPVISDDDDVPF